MPIFSIFIYNLIQLNTTSSKEVYLENFRVTDDCHGQHSHHHVNHIIIIITIIIIMIIMGTRVFRLENTLGRETLRFSVKVASVVAEVGSLFERFRASICKSCRQKVHRTVARARFHIKNVKKNVSVGEFWEDEGGKTRKTVA